MTTDVRAATITGTGTAYAAPTRVRKLAWVNTATAGSIVLRDGGAGGTTELSLATPAAAGFNSVDIPENGIRFEKDAHATLTNVTSLTVFYG